jgi:hypothetical protein
MPEPAVCVLIAATSVCQRRMRAPPFAGRRRFVHGRAHERVAESDPPVIDLYQPGMFSRVKGIPRNLKCGRGAENDR